MNIREIAKLADVSVATVSRCVNKPEKVAEATRVKIEGIIKEYGYTPNPSAQSLSTGMTKTVACVVPDLRNEFFVQLVEGSQAVLAKAGYRLLIFTTEKKTGFWENFDQRTIDGVIVSGIAVPGDAEQTLSALRIPYILIDHTERLKKSSRISNVYVNDDEGITHALDFLYKENNRRFGIICGNKDDGMLTKRRMKAVKAFFNDHEDAEYALEYGNYTDLGVSLEACERLLDRRDRPTAILAFSDMIAAGALRCIQRNGVKIPEEIELIGFDDIPLSAYFNPPLTTLSPHNDRMGEKAAELLLKRFDSDQPAEHIMFSSELILRETTKNVLDPYERD